MNKRLLIVDDELFVRELLQEMCTNLGYTAAAIGSQNELPDTLETGRFDAAIVDLKLNDGRGIDLIAALREMAPDLSIVLMTGYPSADDLIAAMRLGVIDCIVKPFRLREIEGTIARACAETLRKSEIRSLRERVAELEAKSSRKSSRRLVMQREEEIAISSSPLDFVSRSLENQSCESGRQKRSSNAKSSPFVVTND